MGQKRRCIDELTAIIDGLPGARPASDVMGEVRAAYWRELRGDRMTNYLSCSDDDLRAMRMWLTKLVEAEEHELAVAQANAGSVSVSSSAVATASAQATINSTMSQVWGLPDDVITKDQRSDLEGMLKELDDADDESKLMKAGKAVCDWLFDNAVKAVPTVMPFVAQAVRNGLGL